MEHYEEEFVNCPLVSHHRVLRHRLSKHLIRCRRSLTQELGVPSYDGSWRPQLLRSQERVVTEQEARTQTVEDQPDQCANAEEKNENWDNYDCLTYAPKSSYDFQKPPPFMSKKQRKNWRLDRRYNV